MLCTQALNPNYNFSDVAKPYALELLELQDAKQAQGFVLGRLQEQAMQMGSDTGAMPSRVAKMDRCSPLPCCLYLLQLHSSRQTLLHIIALCTSVLIRSDE